MSSPKSLPPDQQERVRAGLREVLRRKGTQEEVAKAIGLAQQTVSRVLAGTSDPGMAMAERVAAELGVDVMELRTGKSRTEEPMLRNLHNWAELEAGARKIQRYFPEKVWQAVGGIRTGFTPRNVTPEWVAGMASQMAQVLGGEGDETDEIRAEMEKAGKTGKKK